jgi:hypothetical protein
MLIWVVYIIVIHLIFEELLLVRNGKIKFKDDDIVFSI